MNDWMRNRDWCEKNCGHFTTCSFGGICNAVMKFVINQTPTPPLIEENAVGKKFYYCPSCEYEFFTYHNYCPDCGHAINWDGIRIKTHDMTRRKKRTKLR